MKSTLVSFTLFCAALTADAALISTPSVQNVRFAQEINAADLVTPPKVISHPAAVYTDEARRRGIQGVQPLQPKCRRAFWNTSDNHGALRAHLNGCSPGIASGGRIES